MATLQLTYVNTEDHNALDTLITHSGNQFRFIQQENGCCPIEELPGRVCVGTTGFNQVTVVTRLLLAAKKA